ncbi:MAG: hypothetical protein KGJ98_10580 [Chloroflexota bacterium]|nr:hypothetical protein [Chloroflexota bacterium]
MVHLSFAAPEWNETEHNLVFRHVADVWVAGRDVHVEGDASVFSTNIRVVEPETGALLTFDSDPERWARALPTAYRSGDLEVTALAEAPLAVVMEYA